MSSSSSSTLPLVRAIALLPDDRFFTTTVALADGQEAGSVAAQVELALEAVSPFPVAQLYQGHFTRPGAKRALAFAAYRKRFAAEETALWTAAELVTPAFVVLLGAPPPAGATTWVLSREDGLTALHFDDDSGVPAAVRVGSWTPEATADERGAVREALLREFPGSRAVMELPAPVAGPAAGESFIFQSGDVRVEFSEGAAAALDVRDKAELAALALARTRDRWLWRSLVGLAALIGLCAFTEVALLGGRALLATRVAERDAQAPAVAEIMTKQSLATRIEELASRRLLPMEMISLVSASRPPSIQFTSTTTSGLYTLEILAQTAAQGDIDVFESALRQQEACERVEVQDLVSRPGVTTFKLLVTFKPDALRPAAAPSN
jgi:hypothetical protein